MYNFHRDKRTAVRTIIAIAIIVMFGLPLTAISDESVTSSMTDAEIKQVLIQEAISGYSGNCPCPYNTDRAGRRCGKRSAYSRPGGASPLCYTQDASQQQVDAYRQRHGVGSIHKEPTEKKQQQASTPSCAENGSCYGDRSAATGRSKTVHVRGYYRKDGTYVRGHYRSKPRR